MHSFTTAIRCPYLQFYDLVGVMEGYSARSSDPYAVAPTAGGGWDLNTGVIAVKRASVPLIQEWVRIFTAEAKDFTDFESGEQIGESHMYKRLIQSHV